MESSDRFSNSYDENNGSFWQRVSISIKKLPGNHFFAILILCILGSLFIAISYTFPEADASKGIKPSFFKEFWRDIGIALFPIGIVSFVYEIRLRKDFIGSMTSTIKDLMPSRYTHLRESGIIDTYPNLRIDKLMTDFDRLHNSEIRILDIWMESFNRVESVLLKAVKENSCNVKILLWNPTFIEAIASRGKSLSNDYSAKDMINNIMGNLKRIDSILKQLEGDTNHEKFEVKLYNSFIGVSFIGFGDECLIGLYLRNRISTMGAQIKVSGRKNYLFKELDNHFNIQWDKDENNTVVFTREKFKELQNWFDEYLCDEINKEKKV